MMEILQQMHYIHLYIIFKFHYLTECESIKKIEYRIYESFK